MLSRETYEIEYRMDDRFTLVGEYDEFDAYNAGVKWRMLTPKKENKPAPAPSKPAEKKEAADAAPH